MQQLLRKNSIFIARRKKINSAGKIRKKVNFIASGKEKTALFITVRQKVDFAAVAKEKMAIFIASRKQAQPG